MGSFTPNPNHRVYVAGHRGMVGSAIVRALKAKGYVNILTKIRSELDLTRQQAVEDFFQAEQPDLVYLAAAKVGGIHANNTQRAEFLYENLVMQSNVIHAAHQVGVQKLLFLGSSCIYPKLADQPIQESSLLTGPLEPTNEPYAIAKIAGIKMCETYRDQYGDNFISVMPTNLYGPGDNYDLENSHVLPALLRKIHTAKVRGLSHVEVWGSGRPMREFLHVDDLAAACLHLMDQYNEPGWLNIGTGKDLTIKELAELIAEVVGFQGELQFDPSKPDGTPRKLLDVKSVNDWGWEATIDLKQGIESVYASVQHQF
jgi:GDP-L-fucose synthase